jgi:TolB-like protein/DNA-binding winged helix-turn-helix (wHTH) protein/Tfp pilus assembly protein PilF
MPAGQQYEFGPFRLDSGGRLLFRHGKRITLTPKAVEVLAVLLEAKGNLVEKDELLHKIWADATVEEGTLTYHVSVLRRALGERSGAQQFIETIPKRGYRFVAPVQVVTDGAEIDQSSPPSRQPKPSHAGWWWAAAAVAAALVVLGVVLLRTRAPSPPPTTTRLLVLPVENLSGDPEHDYVGDGLTEELIVQLSTLDATHLSVIARTSAMSYRKSNKTVEQIGQEMRVDYVLESSLRQSGDRLRITAQLVRTQDQSHVWAASYDRTPKDILSFEDEVASAIAMQIHANLAGKPQAHPPRPEAYLPYLEGRYYWNKRTRESLERAMVHLRQAISLDPNYARAYSALADCYMSLGLLGNGPEMFAQAKSAALTALSLDDSLAEAHTSLAYLKFWQEWDWAGAESEFKKAIALNPDYATAHQWYAEYLRLMGRFDESIAENNKALELDPLSPIINMDAGLPYYFQRRYDKAKEHFQKAIDLDPNFALAYVDLAWVYQQTGEREKAVAVLEKAARLDETNAVLSILAEAYADAGRIDDAHRILRELDQRSRNSYVSPFLLAGVYLSLGDKNRALDLYDKAYQAHDWGLVWLNVGLKFDPIRSDPRFVALLRRMNFPAKSG